MLEGDSRFKKIGKFNEGYAFAELADGRGYVIINEEGEISKKVDRDGSKVDTILRPGYFEFASGYGVVDFDYMELEFHNGYFLVKGADDSRDGYDRVFAITKSGYGFPLDDYPEKNICEELYSNPESFFKLGSSDFYTGSVEEIKGWLDIVQKSMEDRISKLSEFSSSKEIKQATKFAEKAQAKFIKLKKECEKIYGPSR